MSIAALAGVVVIAIVSVKVVISIEPLGLGTVAGLVVVVCSMHPSSILKAEKIHNSTHTHVKTLTTFDYLFSLVFVFVSQQCE